MLPVFERPRPPREHKQKAFCVGRFCQSSTLASFAKVQCLRRIKKADPLPRAIWYPDHEPSKWEMYHSSQVSLPPVRRGQLHPQSGQRRHRHRRPRRRQQVRGGRGRVRLQHGGARHRPGRPRVLLVAHGKGGELRKSRNLGHAVCEKPQNHAGHSMRCRLTNLFLSTARLRG